MQSIDHNYARGFARPDLVIPEPRTKDMEACK